MPADVDSLIGEQCATEREKSSLMAKSGQENDEETARVCQFCTAMIKILQSIKIGEHVDSNEFGSDTDMLADLIQIPRDGVPHHAP